MTQLSQETKDMMERIRSGNGWPEDDLMIVIHVKQKDREKVEKLLQETGLTDNDGVEVVPQ